MRDLQLQSKPTRCVAIALARAVEHRAVDHDFVDPELGRGRVGSGLVKVGTKPKAIERRGGGGVLDELEVGHERVVDKDPDLARGTSGDLKNHANPAIRRKQAGGVGADPGYLIIDGQYLAARAE